VEWWTGNTPTQLGCPGRSFVDGLAVNFTALNRLHTFRDRQVLDLVVTSG
jgi:hypothetical protein